MTYPMMQHIPLKSAYLCQDCNCIGNCAEQCPACASTVLLNLAGDLDRDPQGITAVDMLSVPRFYPLPAPQFTSMVA